jgi:LmbE family N-acetylglucosaminyl deacetylase
VPGDLRLLCVLAHPDDESLGNGGILAKCADEGIETYLLTATRGEQGWFGPEAENPGPEALGRIREEELRCAAGVLGIQDVKLLDYDDGELDRADPAEAIASIASYIRQVRPQVVVTFDQNGIYGHPDHIAICRFTTAAVVAAADAGYAPASGPAHRVDKLYYMAWTEGARKAYEAAFGEFLMEIDGVERRSVVWPDWAISTWIGTAPYWEQVWQAVSCHCTQLPNYEKLRDLPPEHHRNLWGRMTYHRAFSLVNAPDREDDLFAGLR